MKIIKAIIKLNINNVLLTSTFEILLNINNPSHELIGPGNEIEVHGSALKHCYCWFYSYSYESWRYLKIFKN